MCTLSWAIESNFYNILFNYDGKLNEEGFSYHTVEDESLKVGFISNKNDITKTRFAFNNKGLVLVMMNIYHAQLKDDFEYKEVDEIISHFIHLNSIHEVIKSVYNSDFTPYSPFVFGVFSVRQFPVFIMSDGNQISVNAELKAPITTSSFQPVKVIKHRSKYLRNKIAALDSSDPEYVRRRLEIISEFHRTIDEEQPAFSACMKREDAETKYSSHLLITESRVQLSSYFGLPDAKNMDPKNFNLSSMNIETTD